MVTRKMNLILPILCILGIIGCTVPLFMNHFQQTIHGTVLEHAVSSMPLLIALAGGIAMSLPLFVELVFDSFVARTSKKEHLHWYCRLLLTLDLFLPSIIMIIYFHGVDGIENYERVRVLVLFVTLRFLMRLGVVLYYFNNCIQRSFTNTIHSVFILSVFILSRVCSVTMLVYPELEVLANIYYSAYAFGTVYFIVQTGLWINSLRKRINFSSNANSALKTGMHNGSIYLAGLSFEIVSFFVIPYFFNGSGKLSTFSANSLAGKQYAQIIVTLITCTIPSRHSRDESLSRLADSRTKKSFKKYLSAEITRPLSTIALGLQVLEEMVESLKGSAPPADLFPVHHNHNHNLHLHGSSNHSKSPPSMEVQSVDSSSEEGRDIESSSTRRRPNTSGSSDSTARFHRIDEETAASRYNQRIQQIVATKQSCDTALKQLQRLLQQDRFDSGILALELEYVKLVPFLVGTLRALCAAVASGDPKAAHQRVFRYDIGTNSALDSVQPRYRDMYVKVDRQYLGEVIKAIVVQALRVCSAQSEVFFELVVIDNYDSLSLTNMLRLNVHFEAGLNSSTPKHPKGPKHEISPTSGAALVLPFRHSHGDPDDSMLSMEEGSRANPLQGPRTLTLADMFESAPGIVKTSTAANTRQGMFSPKRSAKTTVDTPHQDDDADSDAEDAQNGGGVAPGAATRYVPSGVKGCGSILSQHLTEEILKLHDGAGHGSTLATSGTPRGAAGENSAGSSAVDIVNHCVYSVDLPYFKQILLHNNNVDYDEEDDDEPPQATWAGISGYRPNSIRHIRSSLDSASNSRESSLRRSHHSTNGNNNNSARRNKPSSVSRNKGGGGGGGPHPALKNLPAIKSYRSRVVPEGEKEEVQPSDANNSDY